MYVFSIRNSKEILRDPINLAFGLAFPLVLLLLLSAIQANIPVEQFPIQRLAPGIAMFGLSFITLFSATLISKDRTTSFLARLFSSPLTARDFILGYAAPLLPASLFFIGLGLLCGSLFSDKQVGGLCGALLTNLSAWLSGTWFDLDLVGGWFKRIAELLPFCHAVDAGRAALAGDWGAVTPHLLWVAGYALLTLIAAVAVFRRSMRAA